MGSDDEEQKPPRGGTYDVNTLAKRSKERWSDLELRKKQRAKVKSYHRVANLTFETGKGGSK